MLGRSRRSMFVISFVLTLTALCAVAMAQSGRRTTKTKSVPVTVPQPTPAPTPKATEQAKPALTLVVGMERYYGLTSNDVLNSCVDRLDDNRAVKVVTATGDMSRGDAIKRAKAEAEAYVVWLQLETDSMSGDNNTRNYFLEYSVFAPGTAKLTTSGRTYSQASRKIMIPNPRRSGIYGDYQLQQAAREAADRILSALQHPLPPRTLPNPLSTDW
ncbi:MAG: hypothetical protein M3539_05955 [Acidobacteriota bacterium]|nr:hypothetical protein [Acidobacteriota bacterium]